MKRNLNRLFLLYLVLFYVCLWSERNREKRSSMDSYCFIYKERKWVKAALSLFRFTIENCAKTCTSRKSFAQVLCLGYFQATIPAHSTNQFFFCNPIQMQNLWQILLLLWYPWIDDLVEVPEMSPSLPLMNTFFSPMHCIPIRVWSVFWLLMHQECSWLLPQLSQRFFRCLSKSRWGIP